MQYDATGISLGGLQGLTTFTLDEAGELTIRGEADGVRLNADATRELQQFFLDLPIADNPTAESDEDDIDPVTGEPWLIVVNGEEITGAAARERVLANRERDETEAALLQQHKAAELEKQHTRKELDDMAREVGIEKPEGFATKLEVAEAYLTIVDHE